MTNQAKNVPELRFPEFDGEWEEKQLNNIVDSLKGNSNDNEELPVLTISAKKGWLNQKERFSQVIAGNSLSKYNELKKGDLSYNKGNSKVALYGIVYKLNYDRALVPNVYKSFRPKSNYESDFIEKYFHTKILDKQLRKLITSTARMDGLLNISDNDFYSMLINIPTKKEQQKIGEFFSKLDQQIELEEKKLAKLEEQKKGYMQKIFYQELRFKNENGNNYPEWEEKKLGDLISEISIKTKTNNQYTLLSSTKNGLVSQEEYFRKQIGSKDNTGYKILKLNQMVISPQNLWLGNINFNEQFNIGIVSPSYRVFELNTTFYLPFAKIILRSARYIYEYSQASEQGASVVRRNLNIDLFNDIKINLPIIEEQEKIGNFFSEIDKIIEKQSRKIDGLKSRKKGFLQKMFV